ncbi:hypothetical protein [uncultured Thiohalocapsa sp.]|uniref:hypothetical protein n=1 Tax=uncultured Thiohalocapsa sp. TaxID=768990 RepID=UPI0025CEDBC1|nr:hypothetical protein [uncultured Thiohalocapsa sp.]
MLHTGMGGSVGPWALVSIAGVTGAERGPTLDLGEHGMHAQRAPIWNTRKALP